MIGFNLKGFDYLVLQPYAPEIRFASIPTLDMLLELQKILGFRISLDSIASASLGATKTADGIKSVEWFRAGELSHAVSMNLGGTMVIFFINQDWVVN